ncbi:MBL fold metallo-hydrolase [Chitinispirillales bacterium ANBcel5]|uniref:MBL fold metallo-hydrolase n=1 Tax=Cellulosispirillum alkaliphilum TaxID=3039283 RepID=UPI002A58F6F9|nr:MBL fold metallo-hydrolase [Chitinispirillales bacterium ANBcel5]
MLIHCWGSRGGLPVSGKEFLKYGGDTTCMEIQTNSGERIIIDAGSGIRHLNQISLKENPHIHLIFTHFHLDHIIGFPFFKPLYTNEAQISIYGYPFTGKGVRHTLEKIINEPFFPAKLSNIPSNVTYIDIDLKPFTIGSVTITPVNLNHPNGGLGFRFEENGKSFVFMTDNELGRKYPDGEKFETYVDFCSYADLLLHDAEFDSTEYPHFKGWGHSKLNDVVKLAHQAQVDQLGLFHINAQRTDDQMDLFTETAQEYLRTHCSSTECFAVGTGFEIEL